LKTTEDVDAFGFPWIEPPPADHIGAALSRLQALAAVTSGGSSTASPSTRVTVLGQTLSTLPVDVGIGKTLILACLLGSVDLCLVLAAGLSVQAPFRYQAGAVTDSSVFSRFLSGEGDPFSLLNVFQAWMEQKRRDARHGSRQWCQKNGLIEQRLYEMARLVRQFKDTLKSTGLLQLAYDLALESAEYDLSNAKSEAAASEDGDGLRKRPRNDDSRSEVRRQLRRLKQGAVTESKRQRLSMTDTWEAFADADREEAKAVKDDARDVHALDFRTCVCYHSCLSCEAVVRKLASGRVQCCTLTKTCIRRHDRDWSVKGWSC
jgi:HrpA-like RNA helicase